MLATETSLLYSHCDFLDLYKEPNNDAFSCAEQNICKQVLGADFNFDEWFPKTLGEQKKSEYW